jgi:phosphatidylethanolamine/phosphatidyl-N-methylethanolamine N-methyltransferase
LSLYRSSCPQHTSLPTLPSDRLCSGSSGLESKPREGEGNRTMKKESILRTYTAYAPIYDLVFGRVFHNGRKLTIERMNLQGGEHVLEIGIGSGISLPLYPEEVVLDGIDICPNMLEKARKRVNGSTTRRVTLQVMDAEALQYPDNTFDKVAVMHVYSVVPHPERMLSEVRRVCRPGGEIFILNHFTEKDKILLNLFEKFLTPLQDIIGFRAFFPIEEHIYDKNLESVSVMDVNGFGTKLVRITN